MFRQIMRKDLFIQSVAPLGFACENRFRDRDLRCLEALFDECGGSGHFHRRAGEDG